MHTALFSERAYSEMRNASKKLDHTFGFGCDDIYLIDTTPILVAQPIKRVQEHENPVAGIGTYRFNATRRGLRRMFNLLAIAKGDGDIEYVSIPPGDTIADFQLQKDTLPVVVSSAIFKAGRTGTPNLNKNCARKGKVFDTLFLGRKKSEFDATNLAWEEIWILFMCGEQISVYVEYQPDGKGGYHILTNEQSYLSRPDYNFRITKSK